MERTLAPAEQFPLWTPRSTYSAAEDSSRTHTSRHEREIRTLRSTVLRLEEELALSKDSASAGGRV